MRPISQVGTQSLRGRKWFAPGGNGHLSSALLQMCLVMGLGSWVKAAGMVCAGPAALWGHTLVWEA